MEKAKANDARAEIAPDQRKLTTLQATRLGALTNVNAKELAGHSIAEVAERFKWRIDPDLFFFRKICGKVVKKDPITGVEYPVPFATVYVEDTDCGLLAYFPKHWPWGWHYPLRCHREVIATTTTDKCGNFCVYVPRFDIDWILHWRRERICFRDIFTRPSLGDLLDRPELHPIPSDTFPPHRGPGPDPAPDVILASLGLSTVEALAGATGRAVAQRMQGVRTSRAFGGRAGDTASLANVRAFEHELPPPLPQEFQQVLTGSANVVAQKGAQPVEAVRAAIASHVGVHATELERLDLAHYIGPFHRCVDIVVPEWQVIMDVPDITFRVGQDVDGDGDEETIYSEGFFNVRWDAGAIPDVTLVASSIARESHVCDTPVVPCTDVPRLLFAGLMPLTDATYFDSVNGYAIRPNKPIPPAGPRPPAQTPFLQTLQLYGCVNVPNAHYYRVLSSTNNGGSFSAITGLQWNIYPLPFGPPHLVSPDIAGWYPVLANPTGFHPANMVLEWPTPTLGKYVLKIEVADAGKNVLPAASNVVAIQVDNTAPTVIFTTLAWKFGTEADSALSLPSRNLLVPCPTIRRGNPARDIEIQFDVLVSAQHLRDASLFSFGCGGGSFGIKAPPPTSVTSHWHETVGDNSVALSGRYTLAAGALEGSYGLGCTADSRAMNPSGADGGHLADWLYDVVYVLVQPQVNIAIING